MRITNHGIAVIEIDEWILPDRAVGCSGNDYQQNASKKATP